MRFIASKCASIDASIAFCSSSSSPGDFTCRIASSVGVMSFRFDCGSASRTSLVDMVKCGYPSSSLGGSSV